MDLYLSKEIYLQNPDLGLIIKYEDMVSFSEETFHTILNFICKKMNLNIDDKKFQKCLDSIKFHN